MKKILIFIYSLGVFACRTPDSRIASGVHTLKVESETSTADAAVLEKIVGGLSAEDGSGKAYSCKLTAKDLKNPEQVLGLIKELAKAKKLTAMHFRATVPSIEYYGYLEGERVLIYRDYSTLDFPGSSPSAEDPDGSLRHPASGKLEELLEELCPAGNPGVSP